MSHKIDQKSIPKFIKRRSFSLFFFLNQDLYYNKQGFTVQIEIVHNLPEHRDSKGSVTTSVKMDIHPTKVGPNLSVR